MKEQYSERKSGSRAMRILLFSLTMLLAYVPMSFAQTVKVRGTVTDASGSPLVGVNVIVKGTTIGTTTMTDGKYELSFPPPSARTLVFTYIGMASQEVKVDGQSTINVKLKEAADVLDEVVVVGYGTQRKAHMTGSVVAVSDNEIKKATVSNVSQALVGKLPGIVTQQATGAPGADAVTIRVRGYTSFNGGGGPLCLVDGVERPMADVDPNDIASISVLKDAASCAVYGMRAANGVILITTKKGSEGAAVINYRGSVTLSHLTMFPKFMNGTQYMQYYNKGLEMDNLKPYFTEEEIAMTSNGDPSDGLENTNWQSPLQRTTLMHQHNLSVSGSTEKVSYFVSGGFLNQNGIIPGHENQRGTFRSNVDIRPRKDLKVSLNIAGRIQDLYQPGGYKYGNQEAFNVFHLMMYSLPFVPKELEKDGKVYPVSGYRTATNAANAEYGSQHSGFTKSRKLGLQTSANVEYSAPFLKGLKVGMFASWDWNYGSGKTFTYTYQLLGYTFSRYSQPGGNPLDKYSLVDAVSLSQNGNMYTSASENQQIILRPQISYSNKFGKHDVGALVLYEQTTTNSSVLAGTRKDFALLDLPELGKGDLASASNEGSSGKTAYAGFVGRLNYAYDDKYLVEVSARYDGSYLFDKEHRWGFFPSVSLGWVASHEDFFKAMLPKVEYFKLRASAGILGNDVVSPFQFRRFYGYNANNVAFGTTPTSQGTLMNKVSYPNPFLTWERSRTFDIGFELSAWGGLLGIEFDYFYKYTYNILQSIGTDVYPLSLGGHYPSTENTGTFDNRGFELILKHRNHIGKFNYGVTGNLSFARNRILSRFQADNTLPWQSVLGSSVGTIWGLKSDGLFQTEEELENAPKPIDVQPRMGDIKYVDMNGDGQITSQDNVKIARSRTPEMMFAMTLDADYKGFDISIQLQGAAMTDRMLQAKWYEGMPDKTPTADGTPLTTPWYANYDNAPLYLVENSWRPDHTNAEYPRLSVSKQSYLNNVQVSDFWKRNGAYLRLKNVTIGYTFPRKWMSKAGIGSLRIYASGYNLLTATEFKYIDPESVNVVTGYYPQQRTFSFGADISF